MIAANQIPTIRSTQTSVYGPGLGASAALRHTSRVLLSWMARRPGMGFGTCACRSPIRPTC